MSRQAQDFSDFVGQTGSTVNLPKGNRGQRTGQSNRAKPWLLLNKRVVVSFAIPENIKKI